MYKFWIERRDRSNLGMEGRSNRNLVNLRQNPSYDDDDDYNDMIRSRFDETVYPKKRLQYTAHPNRKHNTYLKCL